jgi:hypothetical protein
LWPSLQIDFDTGSDVLVFVHIQKTGGSKFLSYMVTSTKNGRPLCHRMTDIQKIKMKIKRKLVLCPITSLKINPQAIEYMPEMWLISEKTYGWICGLHPFLTEYKHCAPNFFKNKYNSKERRYHYLTIIRHPVMRYLSEFLHVERGATWSYEHICNEAVLGENAKKACYPGYYDGSSWENLTLSKFMSCSSNWANNRQTLMLADLETNLNCFRDTNLSANEINKRLLQSAKDNLADMAFFGISEYMTESGKLFNYRFSLESEHSLIQKNLKKLHTAQLLNKVWSNSTLYNEIVHINRLDMQLYQYALTLFSKRLLVLNITIDKDKLIKDIQTVITTK